MQALVAVAAAAGAAGPDAAGPAEEGVGGGLGQQLALDHPLALVGVFALPGERGQHRLLCLLELEEQRLVRAVAEQQQDEGLGADRADPYDLAREVAEVVAAEHLPPVRRQRLLVERDGVPELGDDAGVALNGVADDHRVGGPDAVLPVDLVAHLEERLQAGALACLGDVVAAALHRLLRLERIEQAGDLVDVDPGVPDLQEAHCRVAEHLGAVAADGLPRRGVGVAVAEALLAGGDREAGRQALEVPLERGRQGLVEVVDVEDQAPVGRGEHAEVQQVRVAARLHPDAGRRRVRQIPGHRRGRAAEVGKRRRDHAPVPDRHQVGYPGPGLLLEYVDRVRPVRRRLPLGMAQRGHFPALLAPPLPPLLRGEQLVRWGEDARRHSAHETDPRP